ncbi:unnamed protein product [Natator depressus]
MRPFRSTPHKPLGPAQRTELGGGPDAPGGERGGLPGGPGTEFLSRRLCPGCAHIGLRPDKGGARLPSPARSSSARRGSAGRRDPRPGLGREAPGRLGPAPPRATGLTRRRPAQSQRRCPRRPEPARGAGAGWRRGAAGRTEHPETAL